jgi:activating signal cointegrator complex subunit 3
MTAEDKRMEKANRRLKRPNKKSKTSNLEMLVSLGFDKEFVQENHRLGLKGKRILDEEPDEVTATPKIQYHIPQGFTGRRALPKNTIITKTDYYTKHTVPAPERITVSEEFLVPVEAVDEWARPCFKEVTRFNAMQSMVFEAIYYSNDNVLVSAPTGAGKTNIALLGVINVIKQHMDEDHVVQGEFKIVYVAPMKALAAEITDKFSKKLGFLGIKVRELTGDMQLTKTEMLKTHILVTTPEKWDVVTRKSDSASSLVRLIILDEIHLLDDSRGAVLECLVSRSLRQVEISQTSMRIVALSATLPNYQDVAHFIKAPDNGVFYFDGKYRPIPLE